jgi:hypothetical protein
MMKDLFPIGELSDVGTWDLDLVAARAGPSVLQSHGRWACVRRGALASPAADVMRRPHIAGLVQLVCLRRLE